MAILSVIPAEIRTAPPHIGYDPEEILDRNLNISRDGVKQMRDSGGI